jgi:hypothetical protein
MIKGKQRLVFFDFPCFLDFLDFDVPGESRLDLVIGADKKNAGFALLEGPIYSLGDIFISLS